MIEEQYIKSKEKFQNTAGPFLKTIFAGSLRKGLGDIEIRHFQDGDAAGLSTIISRNLREENSQDYASDVIESLVGNFAPDKIIQLSRQREMFVAEADCAVVGTASLARDKRTAEEK